MIKESTLCQARAFKEGKPVICIRMAGHPLTDGDHQWAPDTSRPEPEFDAIHFLDGWTGRLLYLGRITLCHHRHPSEAEAVACLKGLLEVIPSA